jgi:hypothetical protein
MIITEFSPFWMAPLTVLGILCLAVPLCEEEQDICVFWVVFCLEMDCFLRNLFGLVIYGFE